MMAPHSNQAQAQADHSRRQHPRTGRVAEKRTERTCMTFWGLRERKIELWCCSGLRGWCKWGRHSERSAKEAGGWRGDASEATVR
ncbi:hypothetical protein BKA81DRAFT_351869 [Phyllosticta paracitricarpa]